ncbi:MAG: DUF2917 domain-containing protein [Betaproteobacteria bacterium]|nr:DUF2917 domain-containing protein [Betaproteobacteria bacterium]
MSKLETVRNKTTPASVHSTDIFLTQGQAIQVAADQHVVVEPWPRFHGDELSVQWVELQK